MSAQHDRAHDDRLIQALVEDRGADDPQVRAWTAECAECKQRVDGWSEVSDLLDETALDERRALEQIDFGAEAPGKDLVRALVHRELAPRRVWWRSPWVAAAAAGIVAGAWLMRFLSTHDDVRDPNEQMLGRHDQGELAPTGEHADFRHFHWPTKCPPGGYFELRVVDDTDEARGKLLKQLQVFDKSEYTFGPEETDGWPDRIRWEAQAFDSFGTVQGQSFGESARR